MPVADPIVVVSILGVSIALQLAAASVALLNIKRTRAFLPWLLVATAIVLMAVRRITTFSQILGAWETAQVQRDLMPEVIALVISVLMLVGLLRLGPLFRFLQDIVNEKELLLSESLHTTKNNLQSLLSLFRVQEGFLEGRNERSLAEDMERRVRVFVTLQEELFRTRSGQLDAPGFLGNLARSIVESYSVRSHAVDLQLDLQEMDVTDRELLYCGLVLNEALTNAFKHAVPRTDHPRIRVGNGTTEDGTRFLQIRDNGPGLPSDEDGAVGVRSFGLTFFESISDAGEWRVDVGNDGGAVITLSF